jgi:hypothetical protein
VSLKPKRDAIDTATEMIADIVFRPIAEKDFLIRHWYFSYNLCLFASPDYLENHGIPESPSDLTKHSVIGYGEHVFSYCPEIDWHLKGRWPGFPKLHPKVTINSTLSLYQAVYFATKRDASQKLERNVQIFNNFFVNHLKNLGIEVKNEEEQG